MIKLNLGCWKRNFPGWINIDVIDYPHVHFKRDVKDLSIFDDASVDLIYASHCLEYFTFNEAKEALKEWHRVLKPEGQLNIAVPDLEALIKVYQKYRDPLMLRGSIYAITDKVLEKEGRLIFHKMIYDEILLKKILEQSGFTDIKRYDCWEFFKKFLPEGAIDRSASYIPRYDIKNGILVSLNLEARKAKTLETNILKIKHAIKDLKGRVANKIQRIIKGEIINHKEELYKI